MEKKYHVIQTETTALGRFEIRLDSVLENGKKYPYSYVMLKNSVGVLAICEDKVVLVSQYRHAFRTYGLEIPGGAVEEGMTPEETARKELSEETGYIVKRMCLLGEYYPTPGVTTEKCSLFFAECSKDSVPKREPLEYMYTLLVAENKMEELISVGKFRHGMGLVAWLLYKMKVKNMNSSIVAERQR